MTPDLACRAAVAFLDQFIGRGAAPDIHEVRRKLAVEPSAQQAFIEQLPDQDPDERQAFDAFRRFLERELRERGEQDFEGAPDLVELLSWTDWNWDDGSATADPAQWDDWLRAVSAADKSIDR
jgi:hypothetical protein